MIVDRGLQDSPRLDRTAVITEVVLCRKYPLVGGASVGEDVLPSRRGYSTISGDIEGNRINPDQ